MKTVLKFVFLFYSACSFAQENDPFQVFLIGDAGEDTVPGKALLMLKEQLLANPNSAVVFLGDNVYPNGLKPGNKNSEARLLSQLELLQEYKGQVYFVPGNHDWDGEKRNGLKTLKDEEVFVQNYLKKNSSVKNSNGSTFLPHNGLPGPETVMLNEKLRLIIIDTQWFLHLYKRNAIGSKRNTKELFYKQLDSILNVAKVNNEKVIVAAHHPMYSNGVHSKKNQPLRFLVNYTPFQVFGLFGLNRLFSQDLPQPRYKKMKKRMLGSFEQFDGLVYASGHEHNLQLFKKKSNRYIVSGSGSKRSKLRKKKKTESVFQDDKRTGFVKLVYAVDGSLQTFIYRAGEKELLLEGY